MNKTNFKLLVYSLFLITLSSGITYWFVNNKATPPTKIKISNLETNCDIRTWYNFQVVAIPRLNEYWIGQSISLEDRAYKAYELRHKARIHARYMMPVQEEVFALQKRDFKKYGNTNGPTFKDFLKKSKTEGMTLDEAYENIIKSSSKTNTSYNLDCDL